MTSLTRWVLAHKRIVVVFWVLLTLIGMASAGSATKSLKQKFSVPGKEGLSPTSRSRATSMAPAATARRCCRS